MVRADNGCQLPVIHYSTVKTGVFKSALLLLVVVAAVNMTEFVMGEQFYLY